MAALVVIRRLVERLPQPACALAMPGRARTPRLACNLPRAAEDARERDCRPRLTQPFGQLRNTPARIVARGYDITVAGPPHISAATVDSYRMSIRGQWA